MGYTITPKEGVGRSNRLGDANTIKGSRLIAVTLFRASELFGDLFARRM